MARPPRNEYVGGFYHVNTRGNNRRRIFIDARDREVFIKMIERVVRRYCWQIYAYCLMTTHFHLVLELPEGGMSAGMCELNGGFARWSNWRHGREDHLFGKRYSSTAIERDAHLLEACRYVVLNPVRAGLCSKPEDWPWSSYRASAGISPAPSFLALDRLLFLFASRREDAMRAYRTFIRNGLLSSGQVLVPGTDTEV
jgi:REP element-mobilizing transposase RayT